MDLTKRSMSNPSIRFKLLCEKKHVKPWASFYKQISLTTCKCKHLTNCNWRVWDLVFLTTLRPPILIQNSSFLRGGKLIIHVYLTPKQVHHELPGPKISPASRFLCDLAVSWSHAFKSHDFSFGDTCWWSLICKSYGWDSDKALLSLERYYQEYIYIYISWK